MAAQSSCQTKKKSWVMYLKIRTANLTCASPWGTQGSFYHTRGIAGDRDRKLYKGDHREVPFGILLLQVL